jgi:toxin YoeB
MKLAFTEIAWTEYVEWVETDKKMVRRINQLLKDMQRDPFNGIGKPEPLKHNWAGCWSRRLDEKHRLVYLVKDGTLEVQSLRDHY